MLRIFIFFLFFVLNLSAMEDSILREIALKRGMGPVPSDSKKLLQLMGLTEDSVTKIKIELGKKLFFEKRLSKNEDISCATCHSFEKGGADGLPTAIGHKGQANPFHLNSPTVFNSALAKRFFWDGRSPSLEDQAKGPVQAPFEMAATPEMVVRRLQNIPEYVRMFKKSFGSEKITFENVVKAIAIYEKTLLTRGSFDRYLEGDDTAISEKAKRGLELFIMKGCKGCHTGISVGGQSIQKFPLRKYKKWFNVRFEGSENSIFPDIVVEDYSFPFKNVGGFRGKDGTKRFRVPILRNVTKTAPYFHNGAVKNIEEAVRIMGKHQLGIDFSKEEIDSIVEFLKTLEGEPVDYRF
ncbi:cytochrome-c peroxidase [Nitrosophilus alvini]|uniref:cytochrome-c peroxidase n=1 Tax=Nitrosophilus alvini TaxID=2714855 RepID=UPI00190A168B|nr:cytochrome-c peroxidase [Nitrosophilus alvini]